MPNAKIMIVEDERIVADNLKDHLVALGYNVCGKAYSGEEALVIVEKELPDLVLMDIKLEGAMDGIEAAGLIKDRFGIPVIYLTAFSDEHILQRAKMTASFGYLLKPIQYRELHSTIEMALYKHRIDKELLQAKKLESVGILAGGIAHDFNNILAIIMGNAELALEDVPEWNPAHINLEEIKIASLRAKDIVSQLLKFCRKTAQVRIPIQIIPIIKDSLKFLRATIPMSIDIRQDIQATDDTILADPTQINQVLINLCTNADHAMPDGGILEVSLKNVELNEDFTNQYPDLKAGRYVNLTISDTGHGILKEEIDRIFDPYFTTKAVGKGTGMGLAVVHGVVKGHNGIIEVESEVEKGATFNIFFPAVEREAVIETETDEKLPAGDESIPFIDTEKKQRR